MKLVKARTPAERETNSPPCAASAAAAAMAAAIVSMGGPPSVVAMGGRGAPIRYQWLGARVFIHHA